LEFISKTNLKDMEQEQAQAISNDPDEIKDLQDDQVLENNEDKITTDIQATPTKRRTKRDRSPAQVEAFKKAQAKLKEKRERDK